MNNDQPIQEAPKYHAPTRKMRTSPRLPLPPSSNVDFWGPDAVMAQYNPNTMGAATYPTHGNFHIQNGFVLCGMCSDNHTIPVDLNKYDIVEGRIVKKALDLLVNL